MSENNMEELVEYLWQLVTVSNNRPPEGKDIDIGKMSVIVSKLKAADALCEAAKVASKSMQDNIPRIYPVREVKEISWLTNVLNILRKAIADYDVENERK